MFAFWDYEERILEVCFFGGGLFEPYLVEGLAGDAACEMSVELEMCE